MPENQSSFSDISACSAASSGLQHIWTQRRSRRHRRVDMAKYTRREDTATATKYDKVGQRHEHQRVGKGKNKRCSKLHASARARALHYDTETNARIRSTSIQFSNNAMASAHGTSANPRDEVEEALQCNVLYSTTT